MNLFVSLLLIFEMYFNEFLMKSIDFLSFLILNRRFIFFTTSDSFGSLLRANMDGSNHTVIESYKIFYPTSLRLDLANEHIYWLDKYMDYVERVDYNGNNRWSLKAFIGSSMRPMNAIALFEGFIFITKRAINHREMWRISRRNSTLAEKIFVTDEQPLEIRIYHAQAQPNATNLCTALNCQHLCVLNYDAAAAKIQAKCICSSGYQLKSGTECILVKHSTFLIYAKQSPAMIRGISITDGSNDQPQECIVPISNVKWPLSLDYNANDQIIYFGQNDM